MGAFESRIPHPAGIFLSIFPKPNMDSHMSTVEPRPIFTVQLKSTVHDSGMWLSSRSCIVETPSISDAFDFFDSYRAAADDIVGTARQLESITMSCSADVSVSYPILKLLGFLSHDSNFSM